MRSTFIMFIMLSIPLGSCVQNKSDDQLTTTTIAQAEQIIGLQFTEAERDSMLDGLDRNRQAYQQLHDYALRNDIPPSLVFNPIPPGFDIPVKQYPVTWDIPDHVFMLPPDMRPAMGFYSIPELASLVKSGKISCLELTEFFIGRLKQYGDTLECVINLTEAYALKQAKLMDQELQAGHYRGILHGIPYGIKDLFSFPGYPTSWGAEPYKDQYLPDTATVIKKLEDAGAILIAKLSMGALAMGDVWYGGKTRNPWNTSQGSSGSSAGSAAATVAGLVPFAIGTETRGSIVSPSNRCGATGLRPTFGRVSRHGAMALSWSMDKIGPICRRAHDCAIVFNAIYGPDGRDPSVIVAAFNYSAPVRLENMKIGYFKDLFERDYSQRKRDSITLSVFIEAGATLVPCAMPDSIPVQALSIILSAEAAAASDELTRSSRDSLLVRQDKNAWPNNFRKSRFIPAVEYIQANRVRTELIMQMNYLFKDFDAIITPTYGGTQLLATNLTGHPCVVIPTGLTEEDDPTSISILGNLFDEASILAIAERFQDETEIEDIHMGQFGWDPEVFKED